MPRPILTVAELAEECGVCRHTVWNWLQDDVSLRGCVIRQTRRSTYFSRQRLMDRGFLLRELPDESDSIPLPRVS